MEHARPRIALHLLDGSFGGKAVADRLLQPLDPSMIVSEHPIGLEHGPMLAFARNIAAREHVIDRQPQRAQRLVQAVHLGLDVFSEEIGHHDSRFVQHDMAQRHLRRKACRKSRSVGQDPVPGPDG